MSNDLLIRFLLLPFSILYGVVVSFRSFLYQSGVLKSVRFNLPVIGVGNLSVGGTGKTPHVEYLLTWLHQYLEVATLSRGYGRSTTGIKEVWISDKPEFVGDEPLQIKQKFRDIPVFVAENRAFGIPGIIQRYPQTQLIVLDDSFQHRAVAPSKQILLTEYNRPFTRDWLLPVGRLREWRNGAQRADIIIITKCPPELTSHERQALIEEIQAAKYQNIYFSTLQMQAPYHLYDRSKTISLAQTHALLVSAVASTDYLLEQLRGEVQSLRNLSFKDHHLFELEDIETIQRDFGYIQAPNKAILCTEKDAVKLARFAPNFAQLGIDVYVLPTRVAFLDQDEKRFQEEIQSWLLEFKV